MKTFEYLSDPLMSSLFWPGVLAGIAIAILSAGLSVFVVVKRLSFIGQGISHAAFGGVGLAAILGLTATAMMPAPMHGIPQFLIVTGFCLAAGLAVGLIADKETAREDAAIGIILVASMAIGAVLLHKAKTGLEWESFLFGTLYNVPTVDAIVAWVLAGVVMLTLWLTRRSLVFWAFDEQASPAFGVSPHGMKLVLLTLLAISTVAAMKLAGVVLATAILVLPGAIALQLSRKFVLVFVLSFVAAIAGVVFGIVASFEFDTSPGPAIVVVLTLMFLGAKGVKVFRGREA